MAKAEIITKSRNANAAAIEAANGLHDLIQENCAQASAVLNLLITDAADGKGFQSSASNVVEALAVC